MHLSLKSRWGGVGEEDRHRWGISQLHSCVLLIETLYNLTGLRTNFQKPFRMQTCAKGQNIKEEKLKLQVNSRHT